MKTRLFSLWLLLSVAVGLSAYDFKVNGLCYNRIRTASYTVEVTYDETYQELTTANIPAWVTYNSKVYRVKSIRYSAFQGCTKLSSVTIGNDVMSIESSAFSGCTSLTSINIPNSVTSIESSAFSGCIGLTSITIPKSVTSIGTNIVSNCKNLTSIVVETGNPSYDSRNDCNAIINTKSNVLLAGCRTTTIQNSITSIGESAFSGCTGLTSITIPNGVTRIESGAFSGCTGLTSITIPNNVTSIGVSAFSGCTGLTSITIPNNVTSIGGSAFSDCSGLVSITIGSGVTTIGTDALCGCTSLASVMWNPKKYSGALYSYSKETPFFRKNTSDNTYVFDLRPQITSFILGDSVRYIPDNFICENTTDALT